VIDVFGKPENFAGRLRLAATLLAVCAVFVAGAAGADDAPKAEAGAKADSGEKADAAVNSENGKYLTANGDPTYHIGAEGKVDWYTYSGYLRYSSECLRCHGPDGMGSSYAPALVNSLKTMPYVQFLSTVASGRKDFANGQDKVMPQLGLNKNVMCFIDDIYVYLKARSDGALGRNRPTTHEPKPQAWVDAENACMGPPS